MKHTVGCLKQHHRTLFVGFGCFFLGTGSRDAAGCVLVVWVGLVCVV